MCARPVRECRVDGDAGDGNVATSDGIFVFDVWNGAAVLTDEIVRFRVSGERPGFVDMPTLHTHNITNTGSTPVLSERLLTTVAWMARP